MAAANCPERTNWYQCIRLLMEGGRAVLKEFIKKSYTPTGSLDLFLNLKPNKDSLSSLHRRYILNKDQWDKLFPSADLENMDITLLSCIICNCITQPRSVERRAVDDLRELRNSLHGHACTESMNKDEFERNWRKITTVLTNAQHALGVNISLSEFITKIENEKVFNNDLVWDELEAWERVDALMRDMKEQRKDISDVKDELLYVKDRVSNIETKFEDEKKLTIDEKGWSEVRNCLINLYQNLMKSPVAAVPSSTRETGIDNIYAIPELKLKQSADRNEKSLNLEDIFFTDGKKCYNIYVTGDAGMGKTALSKYILSSWCKIQQDKTNTDEMALKQFDFLFYISLRHAAGQFDIEEMIESQLLKHFVPYNKILMLFESKFILNELFKFYAEKCLIILDGLDEWRATKDSANPHISNGVPMRNPFLKYTIITFTRPWKLEDLRLKDSEVDMQINITGVKNIQSKLPAEILRKGRRAIQIYKKALSDGKHAVQNIRVMLVGQSGVGKTTLLKRLLGEDVDIKKIESTEGIEVHVHRCNIEVESGQWHCQDEERPHPNNALLSAIWPLLTGTQEESSLQQVQDTSPRSDTSPITDDEVIYRRQQNVTGIDVSIASEPESKKSDVHASTVRLQSSSSKSDDTKVEQQYKELMETYKNCENLLDSNFANVSFWDFAGQYIFYNTHQVFLSHRTVYLLVTNLLHILDEAGPQGQDCDTKLHDTIEFWVNSIHFFCGKEKHDPSVPPVILVATHCDKVDQAQKEILIHSHFQKVRDIFANKITAGHIVDEMEFAVDNSVEDREFEELKKAIFDVAKTQYYWQEEHPVRWLTLEKELFVKGNSGEKVLQLEAVKDINRMLPYPLKDPELDLFLQFQSDLGNILYISEGQLKDYVLLNPQWVADAFKCIITAEHFLNRKMMLREHWKQAKKTGKINTEIIEAVWRNEESEGFYKEREFLLLLMQQLNLIARPIGTEQPPSHYFVPCLITERPRRLPIPFKGEATSSVLTLSAESRFFPLILFHKLIASCIQKYQIHNNCIYDNSALFADDVHVFTVLYVDNTVKVWVKNLAKAIPDSKVCHSVLKFLIECIRQLLQLSCSKTPSVAIFICCPEVEVYSVQGMHQLPNDIDLWQAQSKKNVLCSNESCEPHSISMGDALKHWIQGPKNSEDQTYKKALDKAWARLVEEMDSGELLDKFMEKELLSPVAIRDLRDEKITSQRNRTVLEKVRTLGPEKYEVFKECLTMIKQEHLAKLLHDYEREIEAQD